ncbi:TetR/AcrR family transcriptional regulator [Streptomyces sp. NPDC019443]|uniref:TetR/AcrR family transcriptional regulator n=1 Tax=Streptomyces sp. NPDC019443 TaxID=3365061 RepID=UPI00378F1623
MLNERSVNSLSGGRREQAHQRREELMDAALKVFADKGLDRATVKDVAAAAGVAPGLLYHYFDSKEMLVVAIVEERGFLPRLRQLLGEAGDRNARQVLTDLVTQFQTLLSENAPLMSLFFSASRHPEVGGALRAFVEEGQGLLAGYLHERVAAGELRPHDTRSAAQMVLASVVIGQLTRTGVEPKTVVELLMTELPVKPPSEQRCSDPD